MKRVFFILSIWMIAAETRCEDIPVFHMRLKEHLFFPSYLQVPAHVKFKLIIENQDNTAEEFDSFDLNREKVLFARSLSTIFIGPLEPGDYTFFGEYNSDIARGTILATDKPHSNGDQENIEVNHAD
ncbi:MAG: cupredoxin domain-containing protein [Pseudomonadales bacterium]